MTFTPSATSSFSAGAVFWGMVWATLGKLNELVHFVGFTVHGISSPLGVTFALGGTVLNMFMVIFIVPIWCRLSNLERR